MRELPQNIDEIREFLNVSDIAEQAGVSRNTVYEVFDGVSKNQDVIATIWQKVNEMAKLAEDAKKNEIIHTPLPEGGK